MKIRLLLQLMIFGMVTLVLVSVVTAIAATNSVPPTRLDSQTRVVTANDVKPSVCASMGLGTIISGSGVITGTNGNDLILGSAGEDTIDGLDGTDCILGGDGNDTFSGGDGIDVCIGGGDVGDSFAACETTIP